MRAAIAYQKKSINLNSRKLLIVLSIIIFGFILFTTLQDYLEATYKGSSFYLSESLLFSSFWWLFILILPLQFFLLKKRIEKVNRILPWIVLISVLVHLFTFPLLVWSISKLFFDNTFRYGQTLQFELSNYLYILSFLYSAPIFLQYFRIRKRNQQPVPTENQNAVTVSELIVLEGRKRIRIDLSEVNYISATPPYIYLHISNRKILHNETLKAVSSKLDKSFIRIHKSTIVNLMEVQSFTSRMNGDYDVILKNGISLRVSRNYAREFREKMALTANRFTTK
jgi:hypothetical protein